MAIGIENLIKATEGCAGVVTVVDKALDGGLNAADIPLLVPLFKSIKLLVECDFDEIRAEIDDLDEVEREKLSQVFEDAFDLRNDSIEVIVENGIQILLSIIEHIKGLIEFKKK